MVFEIAGGVGSTPLVKGVGTKRLGKGRVKKRTKLRSGHRAHVKRALDDVGSTLENYDQTRKQKFLQQKITLNEKLETLKNLDEQILESCKDDDIEAEILKAGSFRFTSV